jgi:putative glycosyltransferase (TIGR04372 family)
MSIKDTVYRHLVQIREGGSKVIARKLKNGAKKLPILLLCFPALPIVVIIRLIRPWLLLRFGGLYSGRIGHFAANTEMYLCEFDAGINKPAQRHIDFFYIADKPVSNLQLAKMWKRVLRIWPNWILYPIVRVNHLIPGGDIHNPFVHPTGLDIYNLLDRFSPHLQFTDEEDLLGQAGLQKIGIPEGASFVCLIVRDSAYLDKHQPGQWNYHNYRDSNIQNYVLAAEELANRGYYVIRMGVHVNQSMKSSHEKVIDYAVNGMRSDFMDIYLGSKCKFCVSTGTGWDAIPEMFRRPIVYVNYVPLGYIHTFRAEFMSITRQHVLETSGQALTMKEIFSHNVGFSLYSSDYESKGIRLVENTPEEIRDAVIEMADRLDYSWHPQADDEDLQKRFWEIFPANAVNGNGIRLHGEIRSRFGTQFLRNNPEWLS